MTRRGVVHMIWLVGAVGAAMTAACSNSTTPHQPTPCPSYSGGLAQGDSLYGLYQLVSYCLDTLPAYGPPTVSGHLTSKLQTLTNPVCRLLLEKNKTPQIIMSR